jgi:hypothetical protein
LVTPLATAGAAAIADGAAAPTAIAAATGSTTLSAAAGAALAIARTTIAAGLQTAVWLVRRLDDLRPRCSLRWGNLGGRSRGAQRRAGGVHGLTAGAGCQRSKRRKRKKAIHRFPPGRLDDPAHLEPAPCGLMSVPVLSAVQLLESSKSLDPAARHGSVTLGPVVGRLAIWTVSRQRPGVR